MRSIFKKFLLLFVVFALLGFSSCRNDEPLAKDAAATGPVIPPLSEADLEKMSKDEIVAYLRRRSSSPNPVNKEVINMKNSLSFSVQNKSGADFYCCCFYYIKNKLIGRWRWEKSKIYRVKPGHTRLIVLEESVDDDRDRNAVFGYLGVFKNKEEALNSVMEIVDETKLLDLDLLYKIKEKVIEVGVKKYGIRGERLAYGAEDGIIDQGPCPTLDLLVENQTGRDIFLTCFVYEQPEHTHRFDLWRYDKTNIKKVTNGSSTYLQIPSPHDQYKWSYMRGVLGVFNADDQKLAENAILELAQPTNKLELGLLTNLIGQKIVLSIEHYGIIGDFIDYTVKSAVFNNRRSTKKQLS